MIRISAGVIMPCAVYVISDLTQRVMIEDCILSDRMEWMDETGGLMQSDTRSLSDSPNGPQIDVKN